MGKTASLANIGSIADGSLGFRNRIINGACVIDQRNAGASVTYDGSSGYSLDRYFSSEIGNGAFTVQQVSDAPAGFTKSLKVTVTTAQTGTLNAATLQAIEGFNIADFAWGTASAKTITLSFWVKSSVTGTLGGAIQNSASNRSYPFTYTINSANTWEQKSITIAGDTSGTWSTDTSAGLWLRFTHGTSTTGTADAWAGADYRGPTGATWVIQTLNATWQVTGVQLEKGSTATSFDYRPYGTELGLCQRYYVRLNSVWSSVHAYNSTSCWGKLADLPVTMRATPTGGLSSIGHFRPTVGGSIAPAFTGGSVDVVSPNFIGTGGWTGSSGLTLGGGSNINHVTAGVGWIDASAEL